MPLFEFICKACQNSFEEIMPATAGTPACPVCGSTETIRQVSMPSPLKTGAFPFKVGPVHPMAKKMAQGLNTSCGASCGTCRGNASS